VAALVEFASVFADCAEWLQGVCLTKNDEIVQVVLSCRVFGLEAENIIDATAVNTILKNHGKVSATIVDTGRNSTCHDFYRSIGFREAGDHFEIDHNIDYPAHIRIV
jgi:predicted enzyme involved in methoxymalonyl-ACP biosynthesis